jgi:uncharacterized protein YaiE (UPF0345 family)
VLPLLDTNQKCIDYSFYIDNKTIGVIEIGKFTYFETEKEFITVSMSSITISVNTVLQSEEKKRAARIGYVYELAFQRRKKKKKELQN